MSALPTVTLDQAIDAERKHINDCRGGKRVAVADLRLVGLSLSGGGVRSACFSLGLLEALDEAEVPHQKSTPLLKGLGLFDYVSSVSGGSYAAGHLATTIIPHKMKGNDEEKVIDEEKGNDKATSRHKTSGKKQVKGNVLTLGDIELISDSVPRWFWFIGVWFIGFTFQILKSGSLLLAILSLSAMLIRVFDAIHVARLLNGIGLGADIPRGFVPFWLVLGTYLGYSALNKNRHYSRLWLTVSIALYLIFAIFVLVSSQWYDLFKTVYWIPAVLFALWVLAFLGIRYLNINMSVDKDSETQTVKRIALDRLHYLWPIMTALFCLAGLMVTGDISLRQDPGSDVLTGSVRSRELNQLANTIITVSGALLGAGVLTHLRHENLLRSVDRVKKNSAGRWDPVYRVTLFLSSYGLLLLLIFFVYSFVARENVSGYHERRESDETEALHWTDFRDWNKAWSRIATDARNPDSEWYEFAKRLAKCRDNDSLAPGLDLSLAHDLHLQEDIAELNRKPLYRRIWFPCQGELFQKVTELNLLQKTLAERAAVTVLGAVCLYKCIPNTEVSNKGTLTEDDKDRFALKNRSRVWEQFQEKAQSLEIASRTERAVETEASTALASSIRNNNRTALKLYLDTLFRDRQHDPDVIFANVVWGYDQWMRWWMFVLALGAWFILCFCNVNRFSLCTHYRDHLLERWLKNRRGSSGAGWLHHAKDKYLSASGQEKRAPLLLFNATLQGNCSFGMDPTLPDDVFTMSPIAIGSSSPEMGYWVTQEVERKGKGRGMGEGEEEEDGEEEGEKGRRRRERVKVNRFARHNHLDLGQVVAISGAFLSPGHIRNPALATVFHLLNLQTGYWTRGLLSHDSTKMARQNSLEWMRYHLFQSLGIDISGDQHWLLTDGAHIDNLGLWSLLERRCALIVASDCSQSSQEHSSGRVTENDALFDVLTHARVKGIEIGPFKSSEAREGCEVSQSTALDLLCPAEVPDSGQGHVVFKQESTSVPEKKNEESKENPGASHPRKKPLRSKEHFLFAPITYPERKPYPKATGVLIYLRPTLIGDEGELFLPRSLADTFPYENPVDQFFDSDKMNRYRLLGRIIGRKLVEDASFRRLMALAHEGKDVVLAKSSSERMV